MSDPVAQPHDSEELREQIAQLSADRNGWPNWLGQWVVPNEYDYRLADALLPLIAGVVADAEKRGEERMKAHMSAWRRMDALAAQGDTPEYREAWAARETIARTLTSTTPSPFSSATPTETSNGND